MRHFGRDVGPSRVPPGLGGAIGSFRIKSVAILLVTMLLLVFEGSVAARIGIRIDFAALVITYLALERPLLRGVLMALAVGYLSDVLSGESRGLQTASTVLAFLGVRVLVARFLSTRWPFVLGVAVVATLLGFALPIAIESLVGQGEATFEASGVTLSSLVIGALLFGYPCFRLFRAIDFTLGDRDEEVMFGRATRR